MFAKKLHGFNELPKEDQETMFKCKILSNYCNTSEYSTEISHAAYSTKILLLSGNISIQTSDVINLMKLEIRCQNLLNFSCLPVYSRSH